MTVAPQVIGVVGAGTMGAGIAQLAASTGARTLLHDPDPEALVRGVAQAGDGLERWRAKGRLKREPGPIEAAAELAGLAPAQLVIEAAPERLELKRELLAGLSAIAPSAVLASNTSSIPITALAGAAADPGLVVGMHFFNPPPVMELVEIVAGEQSSEAALQLARATASAMGRRPIDAADVTGFLVNRVNRPFGLEALRLVTERIADVETVDAIVRANGFRMGPFELQDLVGLDVGLEIARSFHEQSFGEPRWRPSPLSARMVSAGRLGRKTGRGWYAYPRDAPAEPAIGEPAGGEGRSVVVTGERPLARELRALCAAAGFDTAATPGPAGDAWLTLDCGAGAEQATLTGGPLALLCAEASLHAHGGDGAVGFHALAPLERCGVIELTRDAATSGDAAERCEQLAAALGRRAIWVGDAPGLVLGRIVAQLVNEACFAVGEGVGGKDDVDAGMVLGLNHPRGPFAWCAATGADHLLAILDGLHDELGEERYRAAPLLRRLAG